VDADALAAVYAAHLRGDVPYLLNALRDPEQRYLAADYLGDSGDPRAIQPLIPLLGAGDPHVRARAVRSLGKLGAVESTQAVVELARSDTVIWVREWALEALTKIPQADPVPVLVDSLRDTEWSIRRLALWLLAQTADINALDPIQLAEASDRWTRRKHYRRARRSIEKAQSSTSER
jgi:HEAT repeat protein